MNKRDYHLKSKFGITDEQYNLLYDTQGGSCFICGKSSRSFKSRLAIDHDHGSGLIRGLLCFRCNKFVVGRHTKESLSILRRLIEYLDREYTGWVVPTKKKKKRRKCRKKVKKEL